MPTLTVYTLFDLPLDEAVDILWITPFAEEAEAFILQAVVHHVPAGIAAWLTARGRVLTTCRFEHPYADLTYLTLDHAFDRTAANELAAAWNARFYEPVPKPTAIAGGYHGQSLWGFTSIADLQAKLSRSDVG